MSITPVIIFLTSKHPNRCGLYEKAISSDQQAYEEIYSIPVFESSLAGCMVEFYSIFVYRLL